MAPDASLSIKRSAGIASHRCRYKRWQLISIQFYRLQSKLLKRTTATDQNSTATARAQASQPWRWAPHTLLQFSVSAWLGSACLGSARPGGTALMRGNMQSKAKQHGKARLRASWGVSRTSRGKTSRDIRAVELPVDATSKQPIAAQLSPTTYVARKLLPLMTAITFIVLAITIK